MTWIFCPGRMPKARRTRSGMTTWNLGETVVISIHISYRPCNRNTIVILAKGSPGVNAHGLPRGLEPSGLSVRGCWLRSWATGRVRHDGRSQNRRVSPSNCRLGVGSQLIEVRIARVTVLPLTSLLAGCHVNDEPEPLLPPN